MNRSAKQTDQLPARTGNPPDLIPVGLSACLGGAEVRFDGGHKHSRFCTEVLSEYFDFRTFCPEMAAGFGTPRPSMHLSGNPDEPSLVYANGNPGDLTGRLLEACADAIRDAAGLDGFILMKNSPSCGLYRIKVYQPGGHPHRQRSSGLFARALQQQYPHLPLEEEGRLNDARLCENFVLRVYAHHYFRHEVLASPSLNRLIAFHSSYKYVVMAHSQSAYRELGRMLAKGKEQPMDTLLQHYQQAFMQAISRPASVGDHVNTLQHILGYLKQDVSGEARQKIARVIDDYRLHRVPLIAPLTLLRHYIEQSGSDYIQGQRYLAPYPSNLGLSNRV